MLAVWIHIIVLAGLFIGAIMSAAAYTREDLYSLWLPANVYRRQCTAVCLHWVYYVDVIGAPEAEYTGVEIFKSLHGLVVHNNVNIRSVTASIRQTSSTSQLPVIIDPHIMV